MEHAYAQVLLKMVEGGMNPQKAVSALREVLARHGREALLPRIGRAFARIASREARKNEVVLTVARENDLTDAKRHVRFVQVRLAQGGNKELDLSTGEMKTQIDETLIGGWRLEGKEHLVDASYKKSLLSIYNRATS